MLTLITETATQSIRCFLLASRGPLIFFINVPTPNDETLPKTLIDSVNVDGITLFGGLFYASIHVLPPGTASYFPLSIVERVSLGVLSSSPSLDSCQRNRESQWPTLLHQVLSIEGNKS